VDADFGLSARADVIQAAKVVDMTMRNENMGETGQSDWSSEHVTCPLQSLLEMLVRIPKSRAGIHEDSHLIYQNQVDIRVKARKDLQGDTEDGYTMICLVLFDLGKRVFNGSHGN
jgi:hypothetical protein